MAHPTTQPNFKFALSQLVTNLSHQNQTGEILSRTDRLDAPNSYLIKHQYPGTTHCEAVLTAFKPVSKFSLLRWLGLKD